MKLRIIGVLAITLTLAACVTSEQAQERASHVAEVHQNAPQWLKTTWRKYQRDAGAGFGVFALDRNMHGAGYVYCTSHCGPLLGAQNQAIKSAWAGKAIGLCEKWARETAPATVPRCEIYALKDEIVWRDPLPWAISHSEPPSASPEAPSSHPARRSIAVTWEGVQGVLTGTVEIDQNRRGGRMTIAGSELDLTCEGRYWVTGSNFSGRWETDCENGLTARGHFVGLGAGKGSRGEGEDSLGRKVQFILGGAGSG